MVGWDQALGCSTDAQLHRKSWHWKTKNTMTSVTIWIHQIWNILCIHKRCLLFKKRWWVIVAICIIHLFHGWLSWRNWVKFQSTLHSYKVIAQFVSHIYLTLLTSVLGGPSPKIPIQFARNQICLLEPELWQINLSQHNLDSFCKLVANSLINAYMAQQSLWTIFLIMCMLTSYTRWNNNCKTWLWTLSSFAWDSS